MVVKGWSAVEEIGIGIPNPRNVFRYPKPDDMSSEEFERIIKLIEESLDDDGHIREPQRG
jgi:hypothetical protein